MVESLRHYQIEAKLTAVYPMSGKAQGLVYTTLGLNGEAGEVAGEVLDYFMAPSLMNDEVRTRIVKELGDVLWYLAMTATELNFNLNVLVDTDMEAFFTTTLAWECLRLNKTTGRVAELVKKAIRDDDGQVSEDRRDRIAIELQATLRALRGVCFLLGVELLEVAQANLDKLVRRKQEEKLQGEGSSR